MVKYESFEYSPCVENTDTSGVKYVQTVMPECAEFFGVYGRVKDSLTGHVLAEHIVDVDSKEEAETLVALLNSFLELEQK